MRRGERKKERESEGVGRPVPRSQARSRVSVRLETPARTEREIEVVVRLIYLPFFVRSSRIPSSGALHPLRQSSNLPVCHGAVSRGVSYVIGYAQKRAARRCHPDNVARYRTPVAHALYLNPVHPSDVGTSDDTRGRTATTTTRRRLL